MKIKYWVAKKIYCFLRRHLALTRRQKNGIREKHLEIEKIQNGKKNRQKQFQAKLLLVLMRVFVFEKLVGDVLMEECFKKIPKTNNQIFAKVIKVHF